PSSKGNETMKMSRQAGRHLYMATNEIRTCVGTIVELRMARLQKWNVPRSAAPVREHSSRLADGRVRPMYNFNHHGPKAPTAKLKAESECAFCREASAKKDEV